MKMILGSAFIAPGRTEPGVCWGADMSGFSVEAKRTKQAKDEADGG
ncbi:hypothetical protein [Caballeronia sp. LZ034LL]|nr:hypothetical protein [Caballeronia sp. LZ034LL]MDR5833557.1 hypothetical protein [Caballeronia sp. LZ034LL]